LSKKTVKMSTDFARVLMSKYTPEQQIKLLRVTGDHAVKMTAVRYGFVLGLLYLSGRTVRKPFSFTYNKTLPEQSDQPEE
jgi:hypothetical protein